MAQCYFIDTNLGEIHLTKETKNGSTHYAIDHSDLKEDCPYCGKHNCYGDCDGSAGDIDGLENEATTEQRRVFNAAIHMLESVILGHFKEGIDIEGWAYVEGINAALDALTNNIDKL